MVWDQARAGKFGIFDTFANEGGLNASAIRRAAAARGEHEKRNGPRDANWPDWYAAYMATEQAGTETPM